MVEYVILDEMINLQVIVVLDRKLTQQMNLIPDVLTAPLGRISLLMIRPTRHVKCVV